MNAANNQMSANRPLYIDFELHTDGDPNFKQELIELMIYDIKELMQSLDQAIKENNWGIYRSTCHKVTATIALLNDDEFTAIINELKTEYGTEDRVILFNKLSYDIIKSLSAEGEMTKGL